MWQRADPFSLSFEGLGQGMGEDKTYVRPADPPIIVTVKGHDLQRLLQQIDAGSDLDERCIVILAWLFLFECLNIQKQLSHRCGIIPPVIAPDAELRV